MQSKRPRGLSRPALRQFKAKVQPQRQCECRRAISEGPPTPAARQHERPGEQDTAGQGDRQDRIEQITTREHGLLEPPQGNQPEVFGIDRLEYTLEGRKARNFLCTGVSDHAAAELKGPSVAEHLAQLQSTPASYGSQHATEGEKADN